MLTPLWLQSYMGYTSTWAGMTTAWSGVLAVVVAPIVGARMAKVDPRRLVFIGLIWLAVVTAIALPSSPVDATYWQISIPLMLMGVGLPFFFVPLTALSLGQRRAARDGVGRGPAELPAHALGRCRDLGRADDVGRQDEHTTIRSSPASTDRSGQAMATFQASGMSHDQALYALNNLVDEQSVMIATNQIMAIVGHRLRHRRRSSSGSRPNPTRAVSHGRSRPLISFKPHFIWRVLCND